MGLPSGDTLVFDREDGERGNVNELSQRWSRFVRRTNPPTLRWHDLRHGFASLSHDAGESLHSISTALGHSSIGITSSSTNVHTFDETKRRRAVRLDAYLSPNRP
jgi:integrase